MAKRKVEDNASPAVLRAREVMARLRQVLREEIQRQGRVQRELALELGIAPAALSYGLRGRRDRVHSGLQLDILLGLCELLGYSGSQMLARAEGRQLEPARPKADLEELDLAAMASREAEGKTIPLRELVRFTVEATLESLELVKREVEEKPRRAKAS
ncbi:MAG TPA: hypothetical protein PK413_17225 [Thermoanaerobaculia bacterium]|nr:hypothetical protein [Thermoanaerobaculia bacterium]